jgi:hypothetical protein
MFTPDGAFVQLDDQGQGAVNLEFACVSCHLDKTGSRFNWIKAKAKNFHERNTTKKGKKGKKHDDDSDSG